MMEPMEPLAYGGQFERRGPNRPAWVGPRFVAFMRMPFSSDEARKEFDRLLEEEDIAPHAVLWSDVFEGVILSLLLFSPVATVLVGVVYSRFL